MAYRAVFADHAQAEIDLFADYLAAYNPAASERIMEDLSSAIARHVLPRPAMWQFFYLTGEPYRAYLFKVSRRTAYWLVYRIDETAETVDILRFWNSARDPESFEI